MEQLLFWAKYHFLTLKRQFFQKHGFLGNFGRYSYNKYIASRPQKEGSWSNRKKRDRAMKLLVCHQWHRRSTKSSWDQEKIHFHVLCTTLGGPGRVPSYFNLDLCEQFCKEIDYIETGKFCGY